MPSLYYKGEISSSDYPSQYHAACFKFKPRNTKQIANLQHSHQQKFLFSCDALYNIHELSYDRVILFIKLIITSPGFSCEYVKCAMSSKTLINYYTELQPSLNYFCMTLHSGQETFMSQHSFLEMFCLTQHLQCLLSF